MTAKPPPQFELRFARDEADLREAQRLRYVVFVEELGGDGDMVDHEARLEMDALDPFYRHLILFDHARPLGERAIGVYRIMGNEDAARAGGFYTSAEYDLSVLEQSGRQLLELGRSCLHPSYRGGSAMYQLWNGLGAFVLEHKIDVLFGTASFHGTDITALTQPLSLLHHRHLAPEPLRVRAHSAHFQSMDLLPDDQVDRRRAILEMPALIKAYLRLGGCVGEGAFVDHAFNTTDVCLVMDTVAMNAKQKALYTRKRTL
ncbi:MAG: GNAT family N-acetyltransferase [Paracoccaceae bacterium]